MLVLFLVHAVGDFYGMFCAPLLPQLREQYGLSLRMTQMMGTFYLIIQNYSQPVWGFVGDRYGRHTLLIGGVLLSAVGMSALGITGTAIGIFAALAVGGLGVGLFHPCAAAITGHMTRRRPAAMTIFMVGGAVGVMLSPLIVPVLAKRDLRLVALLYIPGMLLAALLPLVLREGDDRYGATVSVNLSVLWEAARKLWWIHLRVVLRSIPLHALAIFLPLYCTMRGYTKIEAGQVQGLALFSSGVGLLLGGWLAIYLSRRAMMVFSEVAAGACLLAVPMLSGPPFLMAIALTMFLGYAVFPVQIVMAQDAAPKVKGVAAALVMGLAYGNASVILVPLNRMAEAVAKRYNSELLGLSRELQIASIGFFLAALIVLLTKVGKGPDKCVETEAA